MCWGERSVRAWASPCYSRRLMPCGRTRTSSRSGPCTWWGCCPSMCIRCSAAEGSCRSPDPRTGTSLARDHTSAHRPWSDPSTRSQACSCTRSRCPTRRTIRSAHHTDHGTHGGLNWSSQHLDRGGVQDGNGRLEQEDQRCSGEAAPAVARGPGLASGDALPGAAGSVAGGATPVLAHDRNRRHDSGSVVSDRRVGPGRHPLVSSRWRHAPDLTGRAHRPISVVRGA